MIRFYWALVRGAPGALWHSTSRALGVLGVVIFVLALLNREWAERVAGWGGFSPWWVVVVIGLLFVYAMALANYERFSDAGPRHRSRRRPRRSYARRKRS
jgi:hypothetical protein